MFGAMRNRVGSVGYTFDLCDMVTLLLEHGADIPR